MVAPILFATSAMERESDFVHRANKVQTQDGIIWSCVQLTLQALRSYCYKPYPIRIMHIYDDRYEPYEITLFQDNKNSFTFKICMRECELNSGFIPYRQNYTSQDMITFLKKCDIVLEDHLHPVFVNKPAYVWQSLKNEISFLHTDRDLVIQFWEDSRRYQRFVQYQPNRREVIDKITDLVTNYLPKIEDDNKVSFFKLEHQWKVNLQKEDYEVSLVTKDNKLFWCVSEVTSKKQIWAEFESVYVDGNDRKVEGFMGLLYRLGGGFTNNHYNFNCIPDDSCAPNTRDLMLSYRSLNDVIKLIKDFTVVSFNMSPLKIYMKPAITHPSKLDSRLLVSKFSYAVAIITNGGVDNNHAEIIVEGIRGDENLEPTQNHLVRKGDYFIHISHLKGKEIKDTNQIETRYLAGPLKLNERTQIWMCSAENVKRMIASIQKEKKHPLAFSLSGCSLLGDNCATWATGRLERYLKIKVERITMEKMSWPTFLLISVAIPGKLFTRPPKEYETSRVLVQI